MIKLEIKNEQNYSAKYVKLDQFQPIPGADRIKHAILAGGSLVIVSATAQSGELGVFFPIESQISKEFLSKNNLFSDKTSNLDTTKTGYFPKQGRVRAVKLRGANSEGFFAPLSYFEALGINASDWDNAFLDCSFDTINDSEICRKYIVPLQRGEHRPNSGPKKKKRGFSRIIVEQARLHYDTNRLQENIHLISPEDEITISCKLHGCQFGMGNVLVRRKLSLWEKIKKFFRLPVAESEYGDVYFSRSVFKNAEDGREINHYYKEDVWQTAYEATKYALYPTLSLYGELVGYTKSGSFIQKGYDYGLNVGEQEVYFYRATETDTEGNVTEWPMMKVVEFCKEKGLKHVPIYYHGRAGDLFPELDVENHWHQEFFKKLRGSFNLEKKCEFCLNPVFAEGICLRKGELNAWKLKAFNFLCAESAALDKGEVDIESAEVAEAKEAE